MVKIQVTFHKRVVFDVLFDSMHTTCFEIPLVNGDTAPVLEFHCKDSAGNPINITGKEVKFFFKKYCCNPHRNIGHEACTIVDGTQGIAQYQFVSGDISGSGTYFGDVQIIFDASTVETAYEACRFHVRDNNQ